MHDSELLSFRRLLVKFRGEFTVGSFANFVNLMMAWIVCPGRHRISRAIVAGRELGSSVKHHSVFYRFFSRARWNVDGLFRVVFQMAASHVPGIVLYLSVDDTLWRRTGPQIWGAGMHHDPLTSNYNRGSRRTVSLSFGLSWVIVSLWVPWPWSPNRGVAIPVGVRLYRSLKTCPEKQYAKRTLLAQQLLARVAQWTPQGRQLRIMGDREYSCRTVLRHLPPGAVFVGHWPMNAALYGPPPARTEKRRGRPRKKGLRLPTPKQLADSTGYAWETRKVIVAQHPSSTASRYPSGSSLSSASGTT